MHLKLLTAFALMLGASAICSAQPACNFGSNVGCAWGRLFDGVGPHASNPAAYPMGRGPIDICYSYDPSCSAPKQSVCKLNDGAWFFAFVTSSAYYLKPRVVGYHVSWFPSSYYVSSGGTGYKATVDFVLNGSSPTNNECDF